MSKIDGKFFDIPGMSVVDNITTDKPGQALDARQGKLLNDRIEALEYDAIVEQHNATKGESVYTSFTNEQSNNIRDGSFTGLYPCDEWSFTDVSYSYEAEQTLNDTFSGNFVLGGFDYFKRVPGVAKNLPAHYALVFAKKSLYQARMNPTDTAEGGYPASEMFTTNLKRADAIFKACFGANHVISATMLFALVNNATLSGYGYYTVNSFLMWTPMLFGSYQNSILNNYSYDPFKQSGVRPILPAIALNPELKKSHNSIDCFCQDVYSAAYFAVFNENGDVYYYRASNVGNVRPAALIY